MEVAHESRDENISNSLWQTTVANIRERVIGIPKKVKKIIEDDPRRIFHALKVGLALTIVSVFYCINPLFNDFGASAMWAVLTVVVVMEFTVGGTLYKGLNRTFATLSAGALAFGVHYISDLAGEKGEPVVLGVFIFILASAATFSRFVPEIKKKYDYGVIIFILTFSLVALSSYRTNEVMQLAKQRFFTISIGVAVCLCTVMVFPVWAGEDLHKLEALNLEKLATCLEGLAKSYSGEKDCSELEVESFENCYKSVLNSKATDDALANFARWEPGHGRFGLRHPWSQYLKIGELSRNCAYSINDALSAYITTSQKMIKKTEETDHERRIRMACFDMSSESSKALNELATGIRTFKFPSAAKQHLTAGMAAGEMLSKILMEEKRTVTHAILDAATAKSLLSKVVDCVQQSTAGVEELARLAHFEASETETEPVSDDESSDDDSDDESFDVSVSDKESSHGETVGFSLSEQSVSDDEGSHVVIQVEASETKIEPMHRETVKTVSDEKRSHISDEESSRVSVSDKESSHGETLVFSLSEQPVSDDESSHVVIQVEASETGMEPMHREAVKPVSDEKSSHVVIQVKALETGTEPMHRETVKSVSYEKVSHVVIRVETSETGMEPMHKDTVKPDSDEEICKNTIMIPTPAGITGTKQKTTFESSNKDESGNLISLPILLFKPKQLVLHKSLKLHRLPWSKLENGVQ